MYGKISTKSEFLKAVWAVAQKVPAHWDLGPGIPWGILAQINDWAYAEKLIAPGRGTPDFSAGWVTSLIIELCRASRKAALDVPTYVELRSIEESAWDFYQQERASFQKLSA